MADPDDREPENPHRIPQDGQGPMSDQSAEGEKRIERSQREGGSRT